MLLGPAGVSPQAPQFQKMGLTLVTKKPAFLSPKQTIGYLALVQGLKTTLCPGISGSSYLCKGTDTAVCVCVCVCVCVGAGGIFKEYLINIPMPRPPYDNLNIGKGKFRLIFFYYFCYCLASLWPFSTYLTILYPSIHPSICRRMERLNGEVSSFRWTVSLAFLLTYCTVTV